MVSILISDFDIPFLRETSRSLIYGGLRQGTRRTYNSAQKSYINFCQSHDLCPVPASEDTILLYVTHLYLNKLKYTSVRVYLSAVRSLHIEEGVGNPIEGYLQVKQAVRCLQINNSSPKQKLPITISVLRDLHQVCSAGSFNNKMLWAAITTAFYGCLRASEFTVPVTFDPQVHLCVNSVTFTNAYAQSVMSLFVKRSKTDLTNKGFTVNICCVPDITCAVCAMRSYLDTRSCPDPLSPLFVFHNNVPLLNRLFQKHLTLLLSLKGYPTDQYSGHSLRIGSATTAASVGLQDWQIKLLGRWTSESYQRYIRAPIQLVLSLSKRLIQVPTTSQLYDFRNPYLTNVI